MDERGQPEDREGFLKVGVAGDGMEADRAIFMGIRDVPPITGC